MDRHSNPRNPQQPASEKLAPPNVGEFALVLLQKGRMVDRMIDFIAEINDSNESAAEELVHQPLPVVVNPGLTEAEALWGQFELICCDAVSIFLRSEIVARDDRSYLWPLYRQVLESPEFQTVSVTIAQVPVTETAAKFVSQFLGDSFDRRFLPLTFEFLFKKARIMQHWASRFGVQLKMN